MKRIVSKALFAAVFLLVTVGNALASMEVKFSDISSGTDPMGAVKPIMPQLILVLGILVAGLLFSGAVGILGSGIKVNVAQLANSIDLRRSGWHGIGSVVAVIFLVTVALVAVFELWNAYVPK
jgi:hypothetical protein